MKVIFCTGNQNKFEEVKDILSQNYPDVELERYEIPDLPEIQGTSREIVMEKLVFAEKYLRYQNKPFDVLMVEDSAFYLECFWAFKIAGIATNTILDNIDTATPGE